MIQEFSKKPGGNTEDYEQIDRGAKADAFIFSQTLKVYVWKNTEMVP